MGLAGWLTRPLRPRRTVRLRLTAMYGVLFLLCGAILLAIVGGLTASSTSAVPAVAHNPTSSLEQEVQQLRAKLATQNQASASYYHQLLVDSAIALAVMVVLAALLGWLLAGRAVRPLRVITTTARRISEHNLNERLALGGPKDELRDLADTIDGLLARLESAFNAQRLFVANASHELRTPLTTMRASLDVAMAKPAVPDQTVALASRLRAELDRIDELLESLLVLARAQQGALPDSATLSLAEVTMVAVSSRLAAIAANGLTLRRFQAGDGDQVRGSAALIGRMIDNVIDNAIAHNEPGGWITVATQVADGTGRVVVENGGAVLDQGQVDQLGQPFRRIRADRTGFDSGSGLGLSIVAAIAAAHGGSLAMQARPQGGLRVTITLPLAAKSALTGARS